MEREKHFLDDFVELLKERGEYESEEKLGEPWYNEHGDCVMYLSINEGVVADRVDEYLTLYRSAVDNRAIGFQLKGVRALMKEFEYDVASIGAEIDGDEVKGVSLSLLLLTAYDIVPHTLKRKAGYAEAIKNQPKLDAVFLEA